MNPIVNTLKASGRQTQDLLKLLEEIDRAKSFTQLGSLAGDYGLDPALGFTIRAMMAATIEATRAHIRMTLG